MYVLHILCFIRHTTKLQILLKTKSGQDITSVRTSCTIRDVQNVLIDQLFESNLTIKS